MYFCNFIDELIVNIYGNLTIESMLIGCLWSNKKARRRASIWQIQGFVQNQKLFRDQKKYTRNDKAQDYHDMMANIFKERKAIRDSGDIQLTL